MDTCIAIRTAIIKNGRIYFGYILNYTWDGANKYAGLSLAWSNNEEKVFFGEIYNQDKQLGIAFTNSNVGSAYTMENGVNNDYVVVGSELWMPRLKLGEFDE